MPTGEKPSVAPSTDIDWGEGSVNINAPLAGTRTAGWLVNAIHPSDIENYLNREIARHVAHLEVNTIRTFYDLPGAIDALAPDSIFRLAPDTLRAWSPSAVGLATGNDMGPICCDGRRIYYVRDDIVYGTKNQPGTLDNEWSRDYGISSFNGDATTQQDIHTDGVLVAVVGATLSGDSFLGVCEAGDGAAYFTFSDAAYTRYDSVVCRVDSGLRNVYYSTTQTDKIFTRIEGGSFTTLTLTAILSTVKDFCIVGDLLYVLGDDASNADHWSVHVISLTNGFVKTIGQFSDGAGHAAEDGRIVSDGDKIFVVMNPKSATDPLTIHAFASYGYTVDSTPVTISGPQEAPGGTAATPTGYRLWKRNLADNRVNRENMALAVDDRYVYTTDNSGAIRVFDKNSGHTAFESVGWSSTSGDNFQIACDGQHLWVNRSHGFAVNNNASALYVPNLPSLWLRAGHGYSGDADNLKYEGVRRPFDNLALPIARI